MAVRSKRDVEGGLKKKGFRVEEGDHRWFVYWTTDGMKTTVRTKTSHGATQDLGDGLLSQMARQLRVGKSEFLGLVDCPVDQQAYEALLRSGDYL